MRKTRSIPSQHSKNIPVHFIHPLVIGIIANMYPLIKAPRHIPKEDHTLLIFITLHFYRLHHALLALAELRSNVPYFPDQGNSSELVVVVPSEFFSASAVVIGQEGFEDASYDVLARIICCWIGPPAGIRKTGNGR